MHLPDVATVLVAGAECAVLIPLFKSLTTSSENFLLASCGHLAMAGITLVGVLFFHAPYGRYAAETVVPVTVGTRVAWAVQELPTLLSIAYFVSNGSPHGIAWPMLVCFSLHYLHRSLIFPFFIRPKQPTPIHVMMLANLYCSFNGVLQANAFVRHAPPPMQADSVTVAAGMLTFITGMYINIRSDYTLINLRKQAAAAAVSSEGAKDQKNKSGYSIPRGFLFDWISCPNFFGEALEWLGYSIVALGVSGGISHLTSSSGAPTVLAASSFFLYTVANTFPRGIKHHQWYIETFGDAYRKLKRCAVIPFVL